MLVKTIMQRYYDEHVTYICTETPRIYRIHMANVCREMGKKHSRTIVQNDVRKYVIARQTPPKRKYDYKKPRGASEATCRQELGALVNAIRHGITHRWLTEADMPVIKLPEPSKEKELHITREQGARLIDEAFKVSEACGMFVVIGMFTGSRPARVQHLLWEQVHFDTNSIDFRPIRPIVRETKKKYTHVRIMPELLPFLQRAYEKRTSRWVLVAPFAQGAALRKAVKNAGLDARLTPNMLRHIWATWAAEDGVSLWAISKVLANSIKTVERKYAHFHPTYQRSAIERKMLDQPIDVDQYFVGV